MAGFGIPSAWGTATPGKVAAPKAPTSMIWGRPATKNSIGGYSLAQPPKGTGGLTGAQTTQGSPQQPGLGANQAPGAQPSPAVTAAPGTTTPAQADPRDASYFANTAANQFKVNGRINDLSARTDQGRISLQDNLAKLAQAQARANTNAQNSENAAGGFALGHLSQTLGQLNSDYLGRQQAANQGFSNLQSADDRGIAGLQAGVPIYNNQELAKAATRASTAASTDNTLGLGTDPTATNPAASPGPAPAGGNYTPPQLAAAGRVNWGLRGRAPNILGKPARGSNGGFGYRGGW